MPNTPEHDEFTRITLSGLPHWLHTPTGRVLPVISGGDGPEGDDGGGDVGAGDGGDGGGDPPKTFTQADLDKLAGRRAAEAKKATEKAIAEQLGVTIDQAKQIIADAKAADDAKKTEADRALEAAQAAKAEADRARAEAAAERFAAKVERKLTVAGVPDTALARATRMITLDADADDDALDAEIDALKADIPGLFTTTSDDGTGKKPPAPSGVTHPKPPPGGQGAKSALERGAEAWRAKHPAKTS